MRRAGNCLREQRWFQPLFFIWESLSTRRPALSSGFPTADLFQNTASPSSKLTASLLQEPWLLQPSRAGSRCQSPKAPCPSPAAPVRPQARKSFYLFPLHCPAFCGENKYLVKQWKEKVPWLSVVGTNSFVWEYRLSMMVMDFIPYSPLSDFTPQRLTLTVPINLSLNFRILRLWNLDSFPTWMSSYPRLTHFWIFRAGGDLNFCHIFQKENLLLPNLGWWLQSLKWGKWVGQGSHCSGFCELWKYQLSQVLKVRKVSGTPYLWIWVEFCVGWAPTVQPLVDPALLVCSDMCWVKKCISERAPQRFGERKEEAKGCELPFLCRWKLSALFLEQFQKL